jgi:protein TonB
MDYAQQQRNPAKHLIALTLVLLLHALVVYAVVNGLAKKVVDAIKKPIEAKVVEEHKPPPPPETPPPPPPKLVVPPPPFIPPPEIQIAVPVQTQTITQVTTKQPPPAPPPPVARPAPRPATPASLDRGSCTSGPDPQYPMASRRNQEAGTLVLSIEIDVNGNPGKVEVTRSSGHPRLDESAKSWVGTCKFKPQTVDGRPVAGKATQAYTFNLRD